MPRFSAPSTRDIINRVESDFRVEAGINPLRRSTEYGLLRGVAGQSKGHYGLLIKLARLGFPDTAAMEAPDLFWRWANVLGIDPKPAEPWIGVYRITGVDTTPIPDETEVVRSDGTRYQVVGDFVVGEVTTGYVDVVLTAQDGYEGTAGNNTDGSPLALASPIVDVDSEGTVQSTTEDGSDEETAEEGLVRLLLKYRNPNRGGGVGDYEFWALEVGGVTRAWEDSPGPQEVTVAFVRDNDGPGADIIPDAGEREEVRAYVQSKAPLTVNVTVVELAANPIVVEITDLEPDTPQVRAAIEEELLDFFAREAEPGGLIRISRLREAISAATGETDHTLVSPAADYTDADDEISVFDSLVVS